MEKAIGVKGLQKSYKKLHVLKGVDFEVEKGSIFALFGSEFPIHSPSENFFTSP